MNFWNEPVQRLVEQYSSFLSVATISGVLLLAAVVFVVTRIVLIQWLTQSVEKTATAWDDVLLDKKVFHSLAHLAPAIVLYYGAEWLPLNVNTVRRVVYLFILFNLIVLLDRLLNAFDEIYSRFPDTKNQDLRAYLQPAKLFLYCSGVLIGFAVILDKPLFTILSSIGAFTAVLLLLFRDTLLSLLASVRISTNNLFHKGDWIEMPQYGADGEVIDISLHHIQIQNWDKTIVHVPTAKLLGDAFKNWRGVTQAGGRRIKRALYLDQTSVQFCDEAMLQEFKKIDLLKSYLRDEMERIKALNKDNEASEDSLLNQVQLTNLGVFRHYIRAYLDAHNGIHHGLPLLVRHLAPNAQGIGLEIYTFTNGTAWSYYESIQADVFDHLLASLPLFQLRVFQDVTGYDVQARP
ncbi:MAG: mechanosensitive ion channel family protein [Deltaproteobacteria bacterium]|nr:MAG: mechanosensitive ion channel family protein [Deltaproteobacteria bacterium]